MSQKKKVLLLTRNSLESNLLIDALKSIDDISFNHICFEKNLIGRVDLLIIKFKNFIRNKKYLKLIHFLISIPTIYYLNKKTNYLQHKVWGNLNINKFTDIKFKSFNNFNSVESASYIKKIQPDIIFVYGTRILSKSIFSLSSDITINLHMGITQAYRGSRSEFWSILNKDFENIGSTIHQIDSGIDTGKILWQTRLKYNNENHIMLRIKNLEKTINDLPIFFKSYFEGNINNSISENNTKGKFYSTPLAADYIKLILK